MDLSTRNGDLMVNNGESWDDNGIYHLVMTNSSPWNITMQLIGKQNHIYIYLFHIFHYISMGHVPWLC
jgi:hypothetical protein